MLFFYLPFMIFDGMLKMYTFPRTDDVHGDRIDRAS